MPKPKRSQEKILKPVRPNLGIEAMYRKKLDALIAEMAQSTIWWVRAAYRENTPRIAADESPASILARTIKQLAKRWIARFDAAAPKLADWFSQAVNTRSQLALKKILKDGGITVEFKMTPAQKDVLDATIQQNVSLIKSIPSQYFTEIEGLVSRSVQAGRDIGFLADAIEKRFGVTRRRAALIARTQNEQATAMLTRAKELEAGIEECVWVHSRGGHHKRPSHVAASERKQRYRVDTGWFDPDVGQHIWPGTLINCRCLGRPVIRGFS